MQRERCSLRSISVASVLASLWLLLVTGPVEVFAQSRATAADLSGDVQDQTGAALPDVRVSVTHLETNLLRSVQTDAGGRFVLPALTPGTYTLRASRPGFAERVIGDVVLTVGTDLSMSITLAVQGLTAQAVVEAAVADTPHAALSHVVDRRQMRELPINGRNFIAFALLTPGAANDRTPQQGISLNSGLTFVGQHARSNNITVDGLDNNEFTVGAVRQHFSQDAVSEFRILSAAYPAEFGKSAGGVVNIVTRSGTNQLAGSLFGYVRDDSLNASDYFERHDSFGRSADRGKAPFGQAQFGGTAGGPLARDRAFFFGAFERQDTSASNFVAIDDQTIVRHPVTGASRGTPAQILRDAGFPIETGYVPYDTESVQLFTRADVRLGAAHGLAARFNWLDGLNENIEPFGGLVARSRGGASHTRQFAGAAALTSMFSARAVNELRAQLSFQDFRLEALDPRCEGACLRDDQGGPTIEVAGVASAGRLRIAPAARQLTRTQVVNAFSYHHARHEFKTGLDVSWIDVSKYSLPVNLGGRFIFAPLPAVPGLVPAPMSAIQSVALGLPAAYVQGYGNPLTQFSYGDISAFVQDEWRLSGALTASLGLRYQTQFFPRRSFVVPGYPGEYVFPSDRNDVAPRLAVSWAPGNRRSVVHGAYGLFFGNTLGVMYTIPAVVDGRAGVRTLALRFPSSIAGWQAPGHKLPEPLTAYPSTTITVDPSLRTPYAHHMSAGVTQTLRDRLTVSATFVRARGFNIPGTVDMNPVVPALGPGRRPADVNGVAGTSASVLQYTAFGESWYSGLLTSWRWRVSEDAELTASYTLSKAEDSATDFQSAFIVQNSGFGRNPADPDGLPLGFDPHAERGPATHDQRHRLVWSGTSRLPARFAVSGILTLGSGRPFNILAGADLNGDGDGGSFPADRARRNAADPASSLARNSGRTPGYASLDLRMTHTFPAGPAGRFEALVEIFNVFNRANFVEMNNVFGTGAYPHQPLPSFGTPLQTAGPRQIQLAARWSF